MPTAAEVFRDFATDGVPASGIHQVDKAEARAWGAGLESSLPISLPLPFVVGDLLYASSTSAQGKISAVAAGQPLISKGTGTKPDYAGVSYKFDTANSRFIVTRNATAWSAAGTTGLHICGGDTGEARGEMTAANSDSVWVFGRMNGTFAAPTHILSGNQIVGLIGTGIDTDGTFTMQQGGTIGGYASQDWTSSNHGFEWQVHFIANGATALIKGFQVGGASGNYGSFYGQFGYATGASAGGTVTQITSRTTGVTINKATGAITLFSAAGSGSATNMTVTNSTVAATDVIIVHQKSGTDRYAIFVTAVGSGSFQITYYTISGTTTEQPVFNFAVIKGSAN